MSSLITIPENQVSKIAYKPSEKRSVATCEKYGRETVRLIERINELLQIDYDRLTGSDLLKATFQYLKLVKNEIAPSTFKYEKTILSIYLGELRGIPAGNIKTLFSNRDLSVKTNTDKVEKAIDNIEELFSEIQEPKDRLIFQTMYRTALRVSDLINLRIKDFSLDSQAEYYTANITIIKTSSTHTVYIEKSLFKQIREVFQGKKYLFESSYIGKGGKLFRGKFTRLSINKRLKKYKLTPHQLRHTRATDLARENVSAKIIQDLLGHSQVNTTINYYFKSDKFKPEIHRGKI